MPVIQRFPHCVVRMYPRDHAPPHVHVIMNDGREVWVSIDPIAIIHGRVKAHAIADVLAWAEANRDLLATRFEELQR